MDEPYEYMKERLEQMRERGEDKVKIDMEHAFRLFHTVCYMKQIRGIIDFQEEGNT
jgi:uncharacterized protein (UPF0262 family)